MRILFWGRKRDYTESVKRKTARLMALRDAQSYYQGHPAELDIEVDKILRGW